MTKTRRKTQRCKVCNKQYIGTCPWCEGRTCRCGVHYKQTKPRQRDCGKCLPDTAFQHGFLLWLLRTFERCPYEESITDKGLHGALRLLGKFRLASNARGYYQIDGVNGVQCQYRLDISHLYPAAGKYVTALSADNLVVMDSSVNRKLGDKDYGFPSTGVLKTDATEIKGRQEQIRFLTEVFELTKLIDKYPVHRQSNRGTKQFLRFPVDALRVAMHDARCTAGQSFRLQDDLIEESKVQTLMYVRDDNGDDVSEYSVHPMQENDAVLAEVSNDVLTRTQDAECDAYDFLVNYKYEDIKRVTMRSGRVKWVDPNDHESISMALDTLCNKQYIGTC